jgi:hypothetical protein
LRPTLPADSPRGKDRSGGRADIIGTDIMVEDADGRQDFQFQ